MVYDGYCEKPERILNITIDNYDGGIQTGTYFRERGHKRALCIADNDICVDMERYQGFRDGINPGTVEFVMIPMRKEERWEYYRRNLSMFQSITTVFAVSDYYAMDLICFLQEQGINVPDQISVAGFDDIPMCRMFCPTLTTIKQDGALRAKIAVEKLRELKEGKPIQNEIRLPVSLVVRSSTK